MQATHEYHKLLERILNEGKLRGDRTGTGTISIFSHTMEFDMNQGFPMITTKKMFNKGIIVELLWFLQGSKDIRDLWKHGVNIWDGNWYPQYAKSCSSPYSLEEMKEKMNDASIDPSVWSLGPIYGKQWIDWSSTEREMTKTGFSQEYGDLYQMTNKSINQIQEAMDKLHNNPEDRRIMVSAWNPGEISKMALPPCHWAFELYTDELTMDERYQWCKDNNVTLDHLEAGLENVYDDMRACRVPERRVSLKWHQRSVDTFLGLPFNIASYAFLLHMFAQQANMIPGTLIGDLTNVHIYNDHLDQVREQLSRDMHKHNSPSLKLNKAKDIFSYQLEDFKIEGYTSYPTITAKMSV